MTVPPPPAGDAPGPPHARVLTALPADAWALLLQHLRGALHDLDDAVLTPELIRIRAAPAGRLAGGRLRRALCEATVADARIWAALAERLAGAQPDLLAAVTNRAGEAETPPEPPATTARTADARGDDRVAAAKGRAREMKGQRDDAVRRLAGERSRGDRLQAELDEVRAELGRLERQRDDLQQRVASAGAEQEQAVSRASRRSEAEVRRLEAELTELRRTVEEARLRRERQRAARENAEQAAADEIARHKEDQRRTPSAGRALRPGRPTILPVELVEGTGAHARALLGRGRRVLVDGYNVTRTQRPDLDLERQRTWLIQLLEAAIAMVGIDPLIIFDGGGEGPVSTGRPASRVVQVRFTTAGLTADDELVFEVAALPDDTPVVVVTDDRELRDRLRPYGVDLVRTMPFVHAAGGS